MARRGIVDGCAAGGECVGVCSLACGCGVFCFALGALTADVPFPCEPTGSTCMDDLTFLSFGTTPCSEINSDICSIDENAGPACQVRRVAGGCSHRASRRSRRNPSLSLSLSPPPFQITCGTCQLCSEPPELDGIATIFQVFPLTDTTVSVWMKSSVDVAGVQGETICTTSRSKSAFGRSQMR